jgi:hypothetical protein
MGTLMLLSRLMRNFTEAVMVRLAPKRRLPSDI